MLYVAAPLNYKCIVFTVEGQIQYNDQMNLKNLMCSILWQCVAQQ